MAESINVFSQSGPRKVQEEIRRLETAKEACFKAFKSWSEDISVLAAEYQLLKKDAEYQLLNNDFLKKDEYIKSLEAENQLSRGQMIKPIQELEKKSISLDPDLRQSPVSSTNIQMQSLKKKCDELEEKLDMERNTSKDLRKDYEYVVEICKKKIRELKSLQENVGPVFDENEKLKSYMQTYEKQTHELKLHHDDGLQTLKAKLQDTKTRLSQLMSAQVMNNNPDIVDLNDGFWPNKLSEMYRELFDNQWSEAFDALQGNERENVQILREILKDARQFCEDEAKLAHCLFGKEWASFIPNTMVKDMKDLTKAVLPYTIGIIGERFLEKKRGDRKYQEMEPYYKECAKVCWIMVLNDPPIEFRPQLKTGYKIDTGTYSLLRSSGDVCDYEVWPALCMSKGGALVSKGVVRAIEAAKLSSRELTMPKTTSDYIQSDIRSSEQVQRYPGMNHREDLSESGRLYHVYNDFH